MQEKLRRRIASIDVKMLNPPRPGKKCLVLDIDYTLFDLVRALYLTICLKFAFRVSASVAACTAISGPYGDCAIHRM